MTILIFKTITRCYGKRVTVFVIAIAAGDSLKYQPLFYGSFVLGEIHVRYNKIRYDLTLVDLTSNFFVLSTNVKVYTLIHSWWSLASIFMKERVKEMMVKLKVYTLRTKTGHNKEK